MRNTLRTTTIALTLASAAFAGSAFASTADKLAAAKAATMDLSQTIAAAQSQHGLKVVEADIELKKKQPVYEVKGVNAQNHDVKLKVSGVDGKVLETKDEGGAQKKHTDRLIAAKISIEDAIATALKHTPGKAVKVDLDDHLGVLSYDVDVINAAGKKVEVRVNAVDGVVKP